MQQVFAAQLHLDPAVRGLSTCRGPIVQARTVQRQHLGLSLYGLELWAVATRGRSAICDL
jgi:hypothetical protein